MRPAPAACPQPGCVPATGTSVVKLLKESANTGPSGIFGSRSRLMCIPDNIFPVDLLSCFL